MRSAEGKGDTGRRVLFAWMTNGYWDGSDAVVRAPGLPKDSLSLPRDKSSCSIRSADPARRCAWAQARRC